MGRKKINKAEAPPTQIGRASAPLPEKPIIDISYLHGMHHCLVNLYENYKSHSYMKTFQEFCNDVASYQDIKELYKNHKGKNGIEIQVNKNEYLKKIMTRFKTKHKNYEIIDDKKIAHLHVNSAFVVFGFSENNRFVVIDLDPEHKFDK